MKKIFITLSGILLPLAIYAQEGPEVIFKNEMYALKISPNGEYIGSASGNARIYILSTGEIVSYPDCELGIGNAIADNGMVAGSENDGPAILYNGKIIRPDNFSKYWFCSFNGITKDGSCITGIVNNLERGITYLPFVSEIDENGNVSDPVILPHPSKDFFNGTPQFCSAIWISDDGKTVGGQVLDSMGYYVYPIVYQKGENGEWSYYLPTESLFNPTGLEIPENPWENEPEYPEPENFMSGALKLAYQEAYAAYSAGQGPAPDPTAYMTDAEYEKYSEAIVKYNDWFYGEQTAIKNYIEIYNKVLATSPTFSQNDFALQPDGKFMAQLGGVINESNKMEGKIYRFDTVSKTFNTINVPAMNAAPKQILPDGTLMIATPVDENPTSWILKPGETEFITVPEFLQPDYPELAQYVEDNFANGSGVLSASYDQMVLTGGLFVTCLTDYNPDMEDASYYYTYIFAGLNFAGIDSIVADDPADGIYRVYNLKGVKVLETKDASQLNMLGKGLYIINGKKIIK